MAKPEEIIAQAYSRVQDRYRAAGAEVPPFAQLVREVLTEISDEMDRHLRKAAKHLQAAGELSAVIRRSPVLRPAAPEHEFTDFDLALMAGGQPPPKAINGHGPRAGGPPPGHPERRLDPDDEEN